MTPPDYREQALPEDVREAIHDHAIAVEDDALAYARGRVTHHAKEARAALDKALASWASRIAEEERERCAKVADHESLFWARALNPPASLGCGGVAERIRAGARSLLGEEGT
jgi:hypothetical protein